MTLRKPDFPTNFVWGAATAAYQVEGAVSEDGRGQSIWDTFTRVPGAISDGTNGDIADDHYHRYLGDLDLMKSLGVNAYRFSISWPRIQADGTGPANPKGLDFYRRVAEACRSRGITPWVTLYHWDLPQSLEDRGGWLERDTAERFGEYSALVVDGLSDVVSDWITLNEPHAAAFAGYEGGVHAPGKKLGGLAARAGHHMLVGHGLAMQALRASSHALTAGITFDIWPVRPKSDSPEDVAAARFVDGGQNRFFLDPVLGDGYPAEVLRNFGQEDWFAANPASDAALISQPIDFLGINYYGLHTVGAPAADSDEKVEYVDSGAPRTQMGWPIHPEGLVEAMEMVHKLNPSIPIYVTENGSAWPDEADADGYVDDVERERYLVQHLESCAEAIRRGIPLGGYFAWTLIDNFEWQFGFSRRFGLAYVDFDTQVRTLKRSGRWLADFLGGSGA